MIKDDILYLSTGSYVQAKDLEGNELDLGSNNNIPSERLIDQEHFTASDGTTYYFKNEFWGKNPYSSHNGKEKIVNHMPTFACIMRLSLPILEAYILLVAVIMVISISNKGKTTA